MQDILVIQPVKVLIMATFVALIIKKLDDEEKSEVEKQARVLAKNEEWLHSSYDPAFIAEYQLNSCPEPPKPLDLDRVREIRVKELKMKAIGRELFFYLFFAFVVFVLGFATRDFQAYNQTTIMKDILQTQVRIDKPKSFYDRFHYVSYDFFTFNMYIETYSSDFHLYSG